MPRFAANLAFLFAELPVFDRLAAAAEAGFAAAEFPFVHEHDLGAFAQAKDAAGVDFTTFNLPPGDLTSGGPGNAAMPGREAEFRQAVAVGLDYARALKPFNVNIIPGWPPAELDRQACLDVLAQNSRFAAEAFADLGIRVTIEPLNTRDRPGVVLSTSAEAMAVIDAADHANLMLEYDIYHMQIMEGDLIETMRRLLPRIGHIQFADSPGRHEPGTGEINLPRIFAAIDEMGYDGWVGAEYAPTGKTEDSLGWFEPYRK